MLFKEFRKVFQRKDVIAFFCTILFFILVPDFDLYITRYFYDAPSHQFYLKHSWLPTLIYELTNLVALVLLVSLPLLITLCFFVNKYKLNERKRIFSFLLCALLLGPGLVINSGFKDHWNRPRPRQVKEFSGTQPFEPPFSPRFMCDKCYSFPSGHASVGFYFFAFALLLADRRWVWAPLLAGSIIGMTRIVQGGHFFSDVVFSGFLTWFSVNLLFYLFFKDQPLVLNAAAKHHP